MTTIAIHDFQTNINVILQMLRNGEAVTLTDHGAEVGRLVPTSDKQAMARRKLAELAKTAVIGDIISPIDVTWNAQLDDPSA